jgi:hypothetical protein
MRVDMFKIIVERPRGGAGRATRSRKRLSKDGDLPTKIGVSRHMWLTHAKSKWLSENLRPLERYLGKQVGRPWNNVYSEISATLTPGNPVKEHVRQHLRDFVVRKVVIDRETGEWMDGSARSFWRQNGYWHQPFYVDPDDGLLKSSEKRWKAMGLAPKPWKQRRKPNADPNVRVLDKSREVRCIEGVWYELQFAHDRSRPADEWEFDLLTHTRVRANTRRAIVKRQLARNELLAHGITNQHN